MSLHLRIPDNRMALGVVVLLSLSVKLTLLFLDKAINTDGILYISAAKLFESGRYGEGWALFPMPAYPFLLYLVHTVIPDWIGAARFISIFAYTAAILPLYALTRTLFDRQAAIWAALLFALSPLANIKSMDIIRDPVFIFCLALYLWCFLGSIRSLSLGLLVAALFFAATSFLFRIEAIVMLGAPCIFLPVCLISAKSREENKWAATSLAIWLLTLGAMLFLAVVIAQHTSSANIIRPDIQSHMEKLFSFSAFDQYHAIYGHLKTVQDSPPFSGFNSSIAAVTRHWMPLVYLVGQTEIFLKALFPVYLIPLLVALKMLLTKQIKGNRPLAFVIFLLGIYFIFVYYAYITRDFLPSRLLYPMVFMLFSIMGKGMEEGLGSTMARSFPKVAIIMVILLFIAAPVGRAASKAIKSDTIVRTVGQWIGHNQMFANQRIVSSEPKILFYADRIKDFHRTIATSESLENWQARGDFGAIEAYASKRNAHAIVILIKDQDRSFETLFSAYTPVKAFQGRKGKFVVFSRIGPREK